MTAVVVDEAPVFGIAARKDVAPTGVEYVELLTGF